MGTTTCFFLPFDTETDRATEISILGKGSAPVPVPVLSPVLLVSSVSLVGSGEVGLFEDRMLSMLCRVASRGERTGEESVDSSPVDWVGAFPSFFWLCVSMLMFIRLRSPFEVDLDEISEPCD